MTFWKDLEMKKQKAFTLVELLVVIAIIALLMSILVPALRKARDQAMRAVCGNNVKNIVMGLIMYADNNRNKLPPATGGWLWDHDRNMVTAIMKPMGLRWEEACETQAEWNQRGGDMRAPDVFYCPANTTQKRNRQQCWDYHHPGGGWSNYRVLGYFFLFNNTQGNRGKSALPAGAEPWNWVSTIDVRQAAKVELITDVTMSDVDAYPVAQYPNGNFASIITGSGQGSYTGQTDTTSHLKSAKEAWGGNMGFVDGHVDWRPFNEMIRRYKTGPVNWW